MRAEQLIVPAVFLAAISQLLATMIAMSSADENVAASVSSSASAQTKADAKSSFTAAWVVAILSLSVVLLSLMSGVTMFFNKSNALKFVLHGLGCILTSLYVLDTWHYVSFWYITVFCALLPALVDSSILVGIFALKTAHY